MENNYQQVEISGASFEAVDTARGVSASPSHTLPIEEGMREVTLSRAAPSDTKKDSVSTHFHYTFNQEYQDTLSTITDNKILSEYDAFQKITR